MDPKVTLLSFDRYLTDHELRLEAVLIGGAALNLLGIVSRVTKDCDILHPTLSDSIVEAARAFAREVRQSGNLLDDDWLNNGPASLAALLPEGWQQRVQPIFSGTSISLTCLGRVDFLRSKLFGLCDRAFDLADCLALAPTAEELHTVAPWLEQQDGNPDWPAHVRATLAELSRRLGHGV